MNQVAEIQVFDGTGRYDDEYRIGIDAVRLSRDLTTLSAAILQSAKLGTTKTLIDGRQGPAIPLEDAENAFNRVDLIHDWLLNNGAYEPVAASMMRFGALLPGLNRAGCLWYADRLTEIVSRIGEIYDKRPR